MSLDGKPAGTLGIVCLHCGGDTFKLLAHATDGLVVGQRIKSLDGRYRVMVAECTACGEHCRPFAKYEGEQ